MQSPTTSNSKTNDGSGTGSFISFLTGLTPNTTYYVRAYATNSAGTAYGNQVSFTTPPNISKPSVSTISINNLTIISASGGGIISSDGGASISSRGICWSTSHYPTTANSKTIDGTGTGNFTSSMSGLIPNTNYYVRAYATNSVGTSYGNEIMFDTYATKSLTVALDDSPNLTTGSYFDVIAALGMNMSSANDVWLDISVPGGISGITILNNYEWGDVTVYAPGDIIYDRIYGAMTAKNYLISAHRVGYSAHDLRLKIRFYPNISGQIKLYYRGTYMYPASIIDPADGKGEATDQQGWPVYVKSHFHY